MVSAHPRGGWNQTVRSGTPSIIGEPESRACLGRNSRLSAVRDKLGNVVVKLRDRLVERSEPGSVGPRELCQISMGHLAVTDDSLGRDIRLTACQCLER